MKAATEKRRQRHLRVQASWETHYTRIPGTRQVPMPGVQCYNDAGEIVTSPAFLALAEYGRTMKTPMLNLIPRQPAPGVTVVDWKPITDFQAGTPEG
jgi:hypothetical protein